MKKNAWLILLIFSCFLSAQSNGFPKQYLPLEGKSKFKFSKTGKYLDDVYFYDVNDYNIHWDISDTLNKKISGNVIMTARTQFSGTATIFDKIVFDLFDNMSVDSVFLLEPIPTRYKFNLSSQMSRLNNRVTMSLPWILNDNQQFKIEIFYHGVPTQAGFKGFEFAVRSNGKSIISSLSEPENAHTWWPCKDMPNDKSTADIYIKTWPFHKAASNGLLIETLQQNGKTVYHWRETYPITTYLISIAASNYQQFSYDYTALNDTTTMPIDCFVYPEKYSQAYEDFNLLPEMIHCYAIKFGEYPFVNEKYGMAMFPWGGAMEHQTCTSYGDGLVRGDHYYDDVVAHELAHQWTGDLVTCATWKDLWLQEGGASYWEFIWNEYKYGETAALPVLTAQRSNYFYEDAQSRFPIYNPPEDYLWGSTTYDKGSWLYQMLRFLVGDEKFFSGMKSFFADNRWHYGSAITDQFIAHLDSTSGVRLNRFKEQWIYKAGYPQYAYAKKFDGNNLSIQLTQEQSSANNTPIFNMPVPVRIQFTDNTDTILVLKDSLNYQQFDFAFNKPLKTTVFDFNYKEKVLCKKRSVAYNSINLTAIEENCELEQNYPNPFNNSTQISFNLPSEELVKITVTNCRGEMVKEILNTSLSSGKYSINFDGSALNSGVYFYRLQTAGQQVVKKMLLCK